MLKNAGIRGDEIKNMLDMQKNLKETDLPQNNMEFKRRKSTLLKKNDIKRPEGKLLKYIADEIKPLEPFEEEAEKLSSKKHI
jgi:hypothetical protein